MSQLLRQAEVERRLFDLLASTFLDFRVVQPWTLDGKLVELPFFRTLWEQRAFDFEAEVELEEAPGRWLLRVDATGNGELYVDGELYQALDEYHRVAVIPAGRRSLRVSVTPRRLFGENPWVLGFFGSAASLVAWEEFTAVLGVMDLLPLARENRELAEALARAASRVTVTPSQLQVYAMAVTLYGFTLREGSPELRGLRWDYAYNASVYGPAVARGRMEDTGKPDPGAVREEVRAVLEELEPLLSGGKAPGEVYLFGHAHIDTAWLWPYSETRRKVRRTLSTVARLAEMGYRFTYVQSGAQNYAWLEEDHRLFEKVRRLVEKGVILPVGGMWVESDTQLVTGESLARQFLYGQRYFAEKFGRTCRIGWLPDSFGFTAQLPQLLRKSGIEVFVTHKVMWNDTNEFPYHAFVWRALDGSEVVAHILVQTYNGLLTAGEIKALWERYKQKSELPVAVHAYGFGDGGGGPTFTMLERLKLLERLAALPRLVSSPSEGEYVSRLLEAKSRLPVWEGEIYNEFHRGVYTTNLRVKQLMARAESEALWADFLSAAALLTGAAKPEATRKQWETVLRAQFHDVLPGSSCLEAYEEAYGELEEATRSLEDASARLAGSIAEASGAPSGSVVVFNRLPWAVALPVELPSCGYSSPRLLACQELEGKAVAVVRAPPLGYTSLLPSPEARVFGSARARSEGGAVVLENEHLRVALGGDGRISSVLLKSAAWEALRGGVELRVHVDKPGNFDAWDIDRSALELPSQPLELAWGPRVLRSGPAVASAEVGFRYGGSQVRLTVSVYSGIDLVEVKVDVDWREKSRLLKAWVDTSVDAGFAHCHVPFGVVKRPTRPVDRRAEAMFEVPALHWVDLSDGSRGVAVIAVDRHGYSLQGNRVGLSLLKSPSMPNPWSDTGAMSTTFYIHPHTGGYYAGGVHERAYAVFAGLKLVEKRGPPGAAPAEESFLRVSGGVLESLKPSEDGSGVVARLYDLSGEGAEVELSLPWSAELYESDIPELSAKLLAAGLSARFRLAPFEVKTILVRRTGG